MLVQLLLALYWVLRIYFYFIIASIILSWLPDIKRSPFGRLISRITDPFMNVFRGLLVVGMLDFTPMIGIILYQIGLNYFYQMIVIIAQG